MRRGGEEREKDVASEMSASHTHSMPCRATVLYRHDRRLRRWWRKVNNLLRFLLMIEEHPKHSVWTEFCPFRMSVVVPVSIVSVLSCAGIGFLLYGVAGLFIFLFFGLCSFFELLHIIFDR